MPRKRCSASKGPVATSRCDRENGVPNLSTMSRLGGTCHRRAIGSTNSCATSRIDTRFDRMGKAGRIIAMAAAHHRFNYIHPFPDGNGRVSRLMSHAMAWSADVAAHGLWSISRGLARGLESRSEYKQMMDLADTPRQGDLDGRGNLSERALIDFVVWFLRVAVDQVRVHVEPVRTGHSCGSATCPCCAARFLKPEAARLLEETLVRGEIDRGEASRITGLPERSARRVLNDVVTEGLLASATPKGPVSLRFPAHSLETLFPRLYPHA